MASSIVSSQSVEKKQSTNEKPPAIVVQAADVLSGRNRASYNHPGNVRFRDVILQHYKTYQASSRNINKCKVVFAVREAIDSTGGRFLKHQLDKWVLATDTEVREKIAHALRNVGNQKRKPKHPVANEARPPGKNVCNDSPKHSPTTALHGPPSKVMKEVAQQRQGPPKDCPAGETTNGLAPGAWRSPLPQVMYAYHPAVMIPQQYVGHPPAFTYQMVDGPSRMMMTKAPHQQSPIATDGKSACSKIASPESPCRGDDTNPSTKQRDALPGSDISERSLQDAEKEAMDGSRTKLSGQRRLPTRATPVKARSVPTKVPKPVKTTAVSHRARLAPSQKRHAYHSRPTKVDNRKSRRVSLQNVTGTMEERMVKVQSNLTMLSMSLDRTTKRMQSIMKLQLAQQKHLLEQQLLLATLQEEFYVTKDEELRDISDAGPAAGKGYDLTSEEVDSPFL